MQIQGREYPVALNLRACRLFEEKCGRKLPSLLADLFGQDFDDVSITVVAAAVWALANSKRGQSLDYEELEEWLEPMTLAPISEQVVEILLESSKEAAAVDSPLRATLIRIMTKIADFEQSVPTGSSSGPSADVASPAPEATSSTPSSGTSPTDS